MAMARGIRNNNPGNIERGEDWQGLARPATMSAAQRAETRFAVFSDAAWGIRALVRILQNYQTKRGLRTVSTMLNRWAPPGENNTGAYAKAVSSAMGVKPDDIIDVSHYSTIRDMVVAIIAHENAGYRYADAIVNRGLSLAGVRLPDA